MYQSGKKVDNSFYSDLKEGMAEFFEPITRNPKRSFYRSISGAAALALVMIPIDIGSEQYRQTHLKSDGSKLTKNEAVEGFMYEVFHPNQKYVPSQNPSQLEQILEKK